MAETNTEWTALLDPVDRLSEVMFGLLMTLTFTGTAAVTLGEGGTVEGILLAALGCNIAWGIVDGVMYLLRTVTERRRTIGLIGDLKTGDTAERSDAVRDLFAVSHSDKLTEDEAQAVARWVLRVSQGVEPVVLRREDFRAALLVFLLVVLSTLPPVVPFMIMEDVSAAMRVSNAIAVGMLVLIGWQLDQYIEHGSRLMRFLVPFIGVLLVATTIALGG
ncbi:MAG: VIT1/CCC1 transporter family protein [Rhodobacterales bacterium]|nr:VIT1/CCC1 transporter family protein [Rhodobacterales bacterium]